MSSLKDIADLAGVSVATASMAVRDHHAISMKTKRRVWEAQEKLGYRLQTRRRSSPSPRSDSRVQNIAFLLIDRQLDDVGGYGRLFQNITSAASDSNLNTSLVTASLEDLRQGHIPEILQSGMISGLIVAGPCDAEAHHHLIRLNLPMVKDGNFQANDDSWMTCEPDFSSGMKLLVRRLEEYGHSRVGLMVRDSNSEFGQHITDYYSRELAMRDLSDVGIFSHAQSSSEIQFGFKALVKSGATAVILGSPAFALDVYDVCEEMGIKVPTDLSIVAIGSRGMIVRPSLAHVASEDRSSALVAKLCLLMKNPKHLLTRELFPMRFVPGGSLGQAISSAFAAPRQSP